MDRTPPNKLDRTKEMEQRAQLLDVQQRAQAVRPINTGADILQGPSVGTFAENCIAHSRAARDRLIG